ncbi:MAG: baseplate J/gp47 family protein, partial [Hyphomicrobium sp.]
SYGAYRFHAMTASLDVLDVGIYGPEEAFVDEGRVHIYVLSRTGSGAPGAALLTAIRNKCSAEEARPLADWVHVFPATLAPYSINTHLLIRRGADAALVAAEAEAALAAYAAETHRVGAVVALSGLYDAAHSPNVIRATMTAPAAEINAGPQYAPHCTGINVTWEVVSD